MVYLDKNAEKRQLRRETADWVILTLFAFIAAVLGFIVGQWIA